MNENNNDIIILNVNNNNNNNDNNRNRNRNNNRNNNNNNSNHFLTETQNGGGVSVSPHPPGIKKQRISFAKSQTTKKASKLDPNDTSKLAEPPSLFDRNTIETASDIDIAIDATTAHASCSSVQLPIRRKRRTKLHSPLTLNVNDNTEAPCNDGNSNSNSNGNNNGNARGRFNEIYSPFAQSQSQSAKRTFSLGISPLRNGYQQRIAIRKRKKYISNNRVNNSIDNVILNDANNTNQNVALYDARIKKHNNSNNYSYNASINGLISPHRQPLSSRIVGHRSRVTLSPIRERDVHTAYYVSNSLQTTFDTLIENDDNCVFDSNWDNNGGNANEATAATAAAFYDATTNTSNNKKNNSDSNTISNSNTNPSRMRKQQNESGRAASATPNRAREANNSSNNWQTFASPKQQQGNSGSVTPFVKNSYLSVSTPLRNQFQSIQKELEFSHSHRHYSTDRYVPSRQDCNFDLAFCQIGNNSNTHGVGAAGPTGAALTGADPIAVINSSINGNSNNNNNNNNSSNNNNGNGSNRNNNNGGNNQSQSNHNTQFYSYSQPVTPFGHRQRMRLSATRASQTHRYEMLNNNGSTNVDVLANNNNNSDNDNPNNGNNSNNNNNNGGNGNNMSDAIRQAIANSHQNEIVYHDERNRRRSRYSTHGGGAGVASTNGNTAATQQANNGARNNSNNQYNDLYDNSPNGRLNKQISKYTYDQVLQSELLGACDHAMPNDNNDEFLNDANALKELINENIKSKILQNKGNNGNLNDAAAAAHANINHLFGNNGNGNGNGNFNGINNSYFFNSNISQNVLNHKYFNDINVTNIDISCKSQVRASMIILANAFEKLKRKSAILRNDYLKEKKIRNKMSQMLLVEKIKNENEQKQLKLQRLLRNDIAMKMNGDGILIEETPDNDNMMADVNSRTPIRPSRRQCDSNNGNDNGNDGASVNGTPRGQSRALIVPTTPTDSELGSPVRHMNGNDNHVINLTSRYEESRNLANDFRESMRDMNDTPVMNQDSEEDIDIDAIGTNTPNRTPNRLYNANHNNNNDNNNTINVNHNDTDNSNNNHNNNNNINNDTDSVISSASNGTFRSNIHTDSDTTTSNTNTMTDTITNTNSDTNMNQLPESDIGDTNDNINDTNTNNNCKTAVDSMRPILESPARQRRARKNLTNLEALHYETKNEMNVNDISDPQSNINSLNNINTIDAKSKFANKLRASDSDVDVDIDIGIDRIAINATNTPNRNQRPNRSKREHSIHSSSRRKRKQFESPKQRKEQNMEIENENEKGKEKKEKEKEKDEIVTFQNHQLAHWLTNLDELCYKSMSDLEHTILFPSYMHKSPNKNKNKIKNKHLQRLNKHKYNNGLDADAAAAAEALEKYENTYLKCVLTLENNLLKLSKLPNKIFDNLLYLPFNSSSNSNGFDNGFNTSGLCGNCGNGNGNGSIKFGSIHDDLCPWQNISMQFYQSQTQFSHQTTLPSPPRDDNNKDDCQKVLSIFEIFCRLYINEITVVNNTISFLRVIGQNLINFGFNNRTQLNGNDVNMPNNSHNNINNSEHGMNTFGNLFGIINESDDEKDIFEKERENDELIENGILKLIQSDCCCDKITTLQLNKYDFLQTPSRIFNSKLKHKGNSNHHHHHSGLHIQTQNISMMNIANSIDDDDGNNDRENIETPNASSANTNSRVAPDINDFSLTPLKKSSQALLCSTRKIHRKIGKSPFKVLDAPKLIDDFYLNLVDWSKKNVLSVALGENVYLWSARTSQVTRLVDLTEVLTENGDNTINGHHHNGYNMVCSVAWSPKGEKLAVGSGAGHVLVFDAHKEKLIQKLSRHGHRVGVLAWKNSKIVASGSRDRYIWVHDTRCNDQHSVGGSNNSSNSKDVVHMLGFHKQEVCGLEWNDDRTYLGSGGNDNRLSIWDIRYPKIPHCYGRHRAAVKAIAWSPHQRGLIATGGGTADRCIRFWNTNTVAPLQYDGVRPGYPIPDTNIATGLLDVKSNHVALMKPLRTIDTGSQVCNLLWSKNVNEIVSTHGYSLNQIVVWRYPAMDKLVTLTGHTYRVLYLAGSPDGTTIVTGAGDETLRFWNVFPPNTDNNNDDDMNNLNGMFSASNLNNNPNSLLFGSPTRGSGVSGNTNANMLDYTAANSKAANNNVNLRAYLSSTFQIR